MGCRRQAGGAGHRLHAGCPPTQRHCNNQRRFPPGKLQQKACGPAQKLQQSASTPARNWQVRVQSAEAHHWRGVALNDCPRSRLLTPSLPPPARRIHPKASSRKQCHTDCHRRSDGSGIHPSARRRRRLGALLWRRSGRWGRSRGLGRPRRRRRRHRARALQQARLLAHAADVLICAHREGHAGRDGAAQLRVPRPHHQAPQAAELGPAGGDGARQVVALQQAVGRGVVEAAGLGRVRAYWVHAAVRARGEEAQCLEGMPQAGPRCAASMSSRTGHSGSSQSICRLERARGSPLRRQGACRQGGKRSVGQGRAAQALSLAGDRRSFCLATLGHASSSM